MQLIVAKLKNFFLGNKMVRENTNKGDFYGIIMIVENTNKGKMGSFEMVIFYLRR